MPLRTIASGLATERSADQRNLAAIRGLIRVADRKDEGGARGWTRYWCARLEETLKAPDAATALYNEAIAIFEAAKDAETAGICAYDVGLVAWNRQRPDDAMPAFVRARSIFAGANLTWRVAGIDRQIGIVKHSRSDHPDDAGAIQSLEQAAKEYESVEAWALAGDSFNNAGACLQSLYRMDDAMASLHRGHEDFTRAQDWAGAAKCMANMGNVYMQDWHYTEAIEAYESSRDELLKAKDPGAAATCEMNIGILFREMGHSQEALTRFREALDRFDDAEAAHGYRDQEDLDYARCLLNAGDACHDLGDVKGAGGFLEQALIRFRKRTDVEGRIGMATCLTARATLLADQRKWDSALQQLDEARTIATQAQYSRGVLDACLLKGTIDDRRGRLSLPAFQEAERLSKESDDQRSLALSQCHIGNSYRHQRRLALALAAYTSAFVTLESLRYAFADPALAADANDLRDIPAALVALTVEMGQPQKAFQLAQRGKATRVRHSLLSPPSAATLPPEAASRWRAEMGAYIDTLGRRPPGPNAATALKELHALDLDLRLRYPRWKTASASPAPLNDVARALGPTTAVIEMLLDQDRVCLIVVTGLHGRAQVAAVNKPVSRDRLERTISAYVHALPFPLESTAPENVQRSKALYADLILPLLPRLTGIRSLVICPDRALYSIPFAALQDRAGHYLVERFAISMAPSASVWEACVRRTRQNRRSGGPAVMVAISRFRAAGSASKATKRGANTAESLPDLVHVADEVRIFQRTFPRRARVLADEAASVARVKTESSGAGVLHFATHAQSDDDSPMLGFLALSPDAGDRSGRLYARDIYDSNLSANLVVLSACSTTGKQATGEGLMGLSWAFLVAGCPSVVATRWPVLDTSSAVWSNAFYKAYGGKKGNAESVRQACLWLLHTRGQSRDYSSPRNWAGWALIGG
jgi:CHAT domain-containing protein/tetratricopeptide (TPR) repeat protein